MTDEEIQRQIQAAFVKMGNKLVHAGLVEQFSMNDVPGDGGFTFTDRGLIFADAIYKLFGEFAANPHELDGIEVAALVQLILVSRPASNN